MTLTLTIRATTTDEQIEAAIPYLDMRREAIERRDDAAAVIPEQGDQDVLELHEIDGVDVLYSPAYGYALVNQRSAGIGNSLLVDNGKADSAEHAARAWTYDKRMAAARAIYDASDDGGVLQASQMLALTKAGHLPNDPTLHTSMTIRSALRAAGLDDGEIEAVLDL